MNALALFTALAFCSVAASASPVIESAPYPADGLQPIEFRVTLDGAALPAVPATRNANGTTVFRWDAGTLADSKARRLRVKAVAGSVQSADTVAHFLYCYPATATQKNCVLSPIKTVPK